MAKIPLLLAVLLLGGCSAVSGLFGGDSATTATANAPAGTGGRAAPGDTLAPYLRTMRDLVGGDPVAQSDAFRAAAAAAAAEPTTSNRLNLALALATPGHPSSNPVEAQKELRALLAAGDDLLPEERTLATVHLKEVEQRLILEAEAQRLQRAIEASTAQRGDQSSRRLQAALEENRQLRAELDEARAKLDAITNIERSIREREHGSNPQ
jgi:hypothetical protein